MEVKEKIRKYYGNLGIVVDENSINKILKDENRTNSILRLYRQEEVETMNYILGKDKNNLRFSKEELEEMNKIDLLDRQVVESCRNIYISQKI